MAYTSSLDPEIHNLGIFLRQEQDIPFYSLTFQRSMYFDYSLPPTFPLASGRPESVSGVCERGWGAPAILYYSVGWLDRWLKLPAEAGY